MNPEGDEAIKKECIDDAFYFIQYTCVQEQADQAAKYDEIAIVTIIIMLVGYGFTLIITNQRQLTHIEQLKYDLNTVTAADFTVEMDISRRAYLDFLKNEYNPKGKPEGHSPGMYLKQYLKKKIDDILSVYNKNNAKMHKKLKKEQKMEEEKKQNKIVGQSTTKKAIKADWNRLSKADKGDMSKSFASLHDKIKNEVFHPQIDDRFKVKVSEIIFAYENHELIDLLKQRGKCIQNMDYHAVDEYDEKINALIRDPSKYETFTYPVCAFITFEKDDYHDIALEYSKDVAKNQKDSVITKRVETIFNELPTFKDATNPSNIIWENRHVKGLKFIRKLTCASIIIFIFLAASFFMMVALKKSSMEFTMKYQHVECNELYNVYGHSDSDKIHAAFHEYALNRRYRER